MIPRDKNTALTSERLKELFSFDAETGVFSRRCTRGRNKKGTVAGCKTRFGYIQISVDGNVCMAHRLAWLYVHGEWPAEFIDHIDGDGTNNRIANLRPASHRTNMQNLRGPRCTNQTGLLGVSPSKGRFAAYIWHSGKSHRIGTFDTAEEAQSAYLAQKRQIHEGCTI